MYLLESLERPGTPWIPDSDEISGTGNVLEFDRALPDTTRFWQLSRTMPNF